MKTTLFSCIDEAEWPAGHNGARQLLHPVRLSPNLCWFYAAMAALVFFLQAPQTARAQHIVAQDDASDAAYSGGWANGNNGGSGFAAWGIAVVADGGFAGAYTGNPADKGITGMSNPSWGMYANSGTETPFVNADRSFSQAMRVGEEFSFKWAFNWDSGTGGNKGFNIYVGSTEVINVNNGGSSAITLNGTDTGFGYGVNAMTWRITYTNATTLHISANDRDGSGTYSTTVSVGGAPTRFRFYISKQGDNNGNREPFFNDLLIQGPPGVPGTPTAGSITASGFTASWTAADRAASYRLDVANDSGFTSLVSGYNNLTVSGTSQAISGLTAGNTYYVRVRAVNTLGTGANSGNLTQITIPPAPVASDALDVVSNSFSAVWAAANGASSYRLDVSTSEAFGAGTFVAGYESRDVGDVTTFSVTNLAAETTYYYRVRAVNDAGTGANSSSITVQTEPTAVVLFYFRAADEDGTVVVRWATASEKDTVGFFVERWDGASWVRLNPQLMPAAGVNGGGGSYALVDAAAVPGVAYRYRLIEIEGSGASLEYGPFDRTPSALVFEGPLAAVDGGLRIRWLSRADESYAIWRSSNLGAAEGGFDLLAEGIGATPPENEFIDADPLPAGFYKIMIEE
jgi:hypothetical protein